MGLSEHGTDEEFKFKLGDEFTYSEDNKDYTVMDRRVIPKLNMKIYLTRACDPASEKQQLHINLEDESKMTATTPLDVLNKLWPNLTRTVSGEEFMNYILNNILSRVCDLHEGVTHDIKFEHETDSFKMTFDGIEFTK
tara:strand:+ start:80 stop:493 length:414 start_codon:yes stop_codon:yes gene_type:complete